MQGTGFVRCLETTASELKLKNMRLTATAANVVAVSLDGGSLEMDASQCSLNARLGRALELSSARLSVTNNVFRADLLASRTWDSVVWKDSNTVVDADSGNEVRF